MSDEWARAALVSLGWIHRGLSPWFLRTRLCKEKVRASLALSCIVLPPQALTALPASALLGSSTETDRAATVARTVAVKIMVA
jgi:hypothetical protein